jgi:hypothetical protein
MSTRTVRTGPHPWPFGKMVLIKRDLASDNGMCC